jgi:hypothetical protein
MKKIYCLVDTHSGYIAYASKSKTLIQELLMDEFMEFYRSEMQEAVDNHWINMEDPSEEDRVFARQTWNSNLNWVNSISKIQKVEII